MRLPGWEDRLNAHVMAHLSRPFRWGRTDCATFAAGAVEALTGVDLARGLRGYRTEAEGLRRARAKGFADHEAVFAAALRAVDPAMLALGDVAVVIEDGRAAMAVWAGADLRVMMPSGMGVLPAARAVRGYAV